MSIEDLMARAKKTEAERQERNGWVELGRIEGLIEAADIAASAGAPAVAKAIRARIPPEAMIHACRVVDESGGVR